MVRRAEVEKLIEDLSDPLVQAMGLSLVDVEYTRERGRRYLRVYIDKPGGVTLDDCSAYSRALGALLDETDPIPERYFLEVASPGLDRPLKKDRDFEIFRGRRVQVRTFAPPEGARPGQTEFRGELLGLADGRMALQDDEGKVWTIAREQVAKARLDPTY